MQVIDDPDRLKQSGIAPPSFRGMAHNCAGSTLNAASVIPSHAGTEILSNDKDNLSRQTHRNKTRQTKRG